MSVVCVGVGVDTEEAQESKSRRPGLKFTLTDLLWDLVTSKMP
jgi:hypothetical protein